MLSIPADRNVKPPPLDNRLYIIGNVELAFFKDNIGIIDEEELKQHILTVQAKAYKIFSYPCIRRFAFIRFKISGLPAYQQMLDILKTRKDAILLDLACCFGNDIRKAVSDGWPVQNAIASDLRTEFWDCGHELFKSTPNSFPAAFIPGDVFDMIVPRAPFSEEPCTPRPALNQLTSFTPLQGHISALHVSSFFHLFDHDKEVELARLLATLLSPAPGSMLLGSQGGMRQKGARTELVKGDMFCHSPESWKEMWDGQVFEKGSVHVEARLLREVRPDLPGPDGEDMYMLQWSVTRL